MINFLGGFFLGWFVVTTLYGVAAALLYRRWQRERGE